MKIRKKMPYYILGIVAIFALCLAGPLRSRGDEDRMISVIAGLLRLSRKTLQESAAEHAFGACTTPWMYTLMPIAAAVPSASYIYEELKSRYYMGVEIRSGKYRYVYFRFFYSALSGAVTVAVGLAAYALMVCFIFPVNPVGIETLGATDISMWELILHISNVILYVAAYGMAMSVLTSFLVYVYPNLYVDLSLLFIVSYILRETAMQENFAFPLILTAGLAVLYGVMWRVRSERI